MRRAYLVVTECIQYCVQRFVGSFAGSKAATDAFKCRFSPHSALISGDSAGACYAQYWLADGINAAGQSGCEAKPCSEAIQALLRCIHAPAENAICPDGRRRQYVPAMQHVALPRNGNSSRCY